MENVSQRDILLYMANTVGAAGVALVLANDVWVGLILCLASAGMIWFRVIMKVEDYESRK